MKIMKLSLKVFLFVFLISKKLYALDINNVSDISKKINLKKAEDADKKEEGPVIALLPFDYTYDVGKKKAESAFNETAISLISTGKYQVFSAKAWADASLLNNSSAKKNGKMSIEEIAEKAKNDFLPMDYLCLGFIFKSGPGYGIRITLYSVKDKKINYYYRTINYFNGFNLITDRIAFEIAGRSGKTGNAMIDRTIYLKDFKITMRNFKKDKKGVLQEVIVPGIVIDRVNYKKEDDFFSELLLYNLYITGIFNVRRFSGKIENSNARKKNGNGGAAAADCLIEGDVELSNKKNILHIKVMNPDGNKILYEKSVSLKNVSIGSVYKAARSNSKNIILALLNPDERNRVGEVTLDAVYNNNDMFCNNYFLGRGMQEDLLVPVRVSEAEIEFFKYWKKREEIEVYPYKKNRMSVSGIKYLIGMSYISGIMLHPLFNDNSEISFSESLKYTSGDLFDNKKSILSSRFHLSTLNGIGINFSIASRYFELSSIASFIFGEAFRAFSVNNNNDIEIDGESIGNLTCNYHIDKYSLIFDLNVMPSVVFPPASSPIRFYAGSGFFASLSYNCFNERINGSAVINSTRYDFSVNYYGNDSLYISLGVSPEFGLIYNFCRFNLKTGFAYNFDLYKYLIFSDIRNSSFNTFNTGNFCVKIGVNYYLN